MKINTFIKLAVLAIMIVATVGAKTAFAEEHAVKVAQKERLGSYLHDIKGMTLYNFKKDSPGKSSSAGPCVADRPLFYQKTFDAQDGWQREISRRLPGQAAKSRRPTRECALLFQQGRKARRYIRPGI